MFAWHIIGSSGSICIIVIINVAHIIVGFISVSGFGIDRTLVFVVIVGVFFIQSLAGGGISSCCC